MNNGDLCPYHGLPVLRLVDEDPNTWACDQCWNSAKWYITDIDGNTKEVFPKI